MNLIFIQAWKRFLLLLLCSLSLPVLAQVKVNVSGASVGAKSIAIVPVQGDVEAKMDFMIASDLHKSALFRPLDPRTYPMRPQTPEQVDFNQFAALGADYVVLSRALHPNLTALQMVILDVHSRQVVANENIQAPNAVQTAHQTADRILFYLTGKTGVFATKIAFVAERGGGAQRRYSLVVANMDGSQRQEIYHSDLPILSPSWSPNGQALAFATYAQHQSQIMIANLAGGVRLVAQTPHTLSAPEFSPDGSSLAFVQSENGNSDVYRIDLGSGSVKRLTEHQAIDTEPVFSADGRFIYFTSDRSGRPQIYRMPAQGGAATAITQGSASHMGSSRPSADGRSLALTQKNGGRTQIGILQLANGSFKALSQGQADEGASFAPNGHMLIYATRAGGASVLHIINHQGGVVQTIAESGAHLRDPAWAYDPRPSY